ncbi:uncharacterized protein LACBIDRAFT_334562 [Laccaria bicolor S238N-H82]|uniref:Predicted protein n=1 Tax=Laccaria bicolor (strain S238N-H82 / ATCC MYA-4686) TaxID=486041 RepID=B0DZN6_LACBS|nr:uncharacterized protein LACBIDRAFT_334562 [Laccaria bicolor S238N-H82]EDQ99975.1 predicted protein [Laccaria bicolor S238N-H82]|eukprot:XP_001889386.1 predicted protein [Laccaria bicolor S238N-H82]
MSSHSEDSEALEFPSSPGGEQRGWGSDSGDVGEPGEEADDRSNRKGHPGHVDMVMRPIMEVQEVEEDSDRDKVDFDLPQVLKIHVPARVTNPMCQSSPAVKGSKVKPMKRARNNAFTDEEDGEALPEKMKATPKCTVTKDPAKKKQKPTKLQHAKNSTKDRFIKQAPKRAGPFELMEKMGWERFLCEVVEITGQETENLDTTSMSWSFQKKEMYPLTNVASFKTMVTQVKSLKDPSSTIIVICLPIPKAQQTTIWAPQTMAEQVEQRLGQMPDDSLYGKKLSIDAQLVPIVEKLEELYPLGQCLRHPDVCCVAASNGWHFDIDTTRIKVWALAVVRRVTDVHCMLLGTNHFLTNQQIGGMAGDKHLPCPQMPGPNSYTVHSPWNMGSGHPQTYGSPQAYGSPLVFNQPQYPMFSLSPGSYHPIHGTGHLAAPVSPPNSSNAGPHKALHGWCMTKNLGEDEFSALVKLGYRVGDKFEVAELEHCPDWTSLAFFVRRRVLDAICDV